MRSRPSRRTWASWRCWPGCGSFRPGSNAPPWPGILWTPPCARPTSRSPRNEGGDAMNLFKWLNKAERMEPAATPEEAGLKGRVIEALRTVYDPELPVNIYDLGLVYELMADETSGVVHIRMTLTAPGCPVAQTFPGVVEQAVEEVAGVSEATVELVWDPPWSRERMSEAAKLDLGL